MYDTFVKETGVDLHQIITPNKTLVGNPVTDIVDAFAICKLFWNQLKVQE